MKRPLLINIVAHLAGWLFLFSLVIAFLSNSGDGQSVSEQLFSPPFLLFYFVYLYLFYFNTYFLIPQFYLKRKYIIYFLAIAVLFILVYFIKPFDGLMAVHRPPMGSPPGSGGPDGPGFGPDGPSPGGWPQGGPKGHDTDITSLILFITVWSFSTALCIIKQWRLTEQRATQAEADKANAELSFLKAQINPHFLFNTLNNIYSLAVTNDANTAGSIMKLSNIMRYVTDEVGEDYVQLDSEIECLTDYIDLQRMRLGKTMDVKLEVTGTTIGKKIAPLILMTFIENVFKYGTSNHEASVITIRIDVSEQDIHFFCQNRLFENKIVTDRTGIGIANTRQRLDHLYPGKYALNINAENGLYTVELRLDA